MTDPVNTPAQPASPAPAATPSATPTPAAAPATAGSGTSAEGGDRGRNSDDWVTPDVRKALDFDPFTPAGDELNPTTTPDGSPSADGTPGTPGQPASVTQVPAQNGGTPQPAAQPAAQPNVPMTPEQVAAIVQENQRLLNLVKAGPQTQPGQTQTPAPQGQQPQGQPQPGQAQGPDVFAAPDYAFQIPDVLIAKLASEDPNERKAAIGATLQGVSRAVHETLANQVRHALHGLQQSLPQVIQHVVAYHQQEQSVANDFYTKYPQLNTPHLRGIVQKIAEEHMKVTQNYSWSPELRDSIATKVITQLAGVIPVQAPANPAPVTNPPVMLGGNGAAGGGHTRMTGSTGQKTQLDHMADVMDF